VSRSPAGVILIAVALALVAGASACRDDDDGGAAVPDGRDTCVGLDLATCRTTAGCVADTCFACNCAPTFEGCRAASAPPFQCPALGCQQPECCHATADCASALCLEPGGDPGCGVCNPGPSQCADDGACGDGMICEPLHCACDGAARACVPGCTGDDACGAGKVCDPATHRCAGAPCEGPADCPLDFGCRPDGVCGRRACLDDTGCDGYCVSARCYDALGTCTFPPP